MNNIATVKVRAEATVNCEWTVTFQDGTVRSYYSIDQGSPQSAEDDSRLNETNEELANFLQELWYGMDVDDDDTEATTVLFDGRGKAIKNL